MLPRANRERSKRDVSKLKLSPRSAEIQRLIGRSLREAVDLTMLPDLTITIDCDVLQGDGGTRTASVTGGYLALAIACDRLVKDGVLLRSPIKGYVAAISAGIVDEQPLLDLCYEEDSSAQVDLNCVMNDAGELIELQGTGEGRAFTVAEQQQLVALCQKGIRQLIAKQKAVLEVCLQADVGVDVDVEETGTTFEENSRLKAQAVMEASGLPAIADDSGLCVDALGGAPGVYSARYGGPDLDDAGRYRLLLENMKGQPRAARFVSVITCCFPNGDVLTARGECPGTIAFAPMGEGGFGYDPVFFVPQLKKTFAQLTPEEKHAISHRGQALGRFSQELQRYLDQQ
jgi:ribonuclease PH/non-canonical purine NTP pyrophosphatase (RdgB/HAM1 family)